ncbi:GPP34 family phosphoprotein [Nocardia gamkensis]|uniref:Uncharacterized protein n=1 Tax=Nocardia gamkensis TaxID=352869 RepID=A0A7X6L1F5_9NOCA|nr:GPP34 family phosphoprotein [Nocardia gamkensis]NKY25879.1 hypothetical protein [Nocardia gamkensis]NQE68927.1 hypothetical protein [Nocardia gamkensis]
MNLLAGDLMLLLLDERTWRSMADSTRTPRVLAGAVLLDLIDAGAIRPAGPGDEAKPGRIVVSANKSADPNRGDLSVDRTHRRSGRAEAASAAHRWLTVEYATVGRRKCLSRDRVRTTRFSRLALAHRHGPSPAYRLA